MRCKCKHGRCHSFDSWGVKFSSEASDEQATSNVQFIQFIGESGAKPPEAESFLYIFIQKSDQKLRI